MSWQAIRWVLDYSPTKNTDRMVLVVLAEHAHDDGTEAWPCYATIARKANISHRTVPGVMRRLERCGAVTRTQPARQHSPAHYTVLMTPAAARGRPPTTSADDDQRSPADDLWRPGVAGQRVQRSLANDLNLPEPPKLESDMSNIAANAEPISDGNEAAIDPASAMFVPSPAAAVTLSPSSPSPSNPHDNEGTPTTCSSRPRPTPNAASAMSKVASPPSTASPASASSTSSSMRPGGGSSKNPAPVDSSTSWNSGAATASDSAEDKQRRKAIEDERWDAIVTAAIAGH